MNQNFGILGLKEGESYLSNVLVLGASGMLGKMCSLVLDEVENLNLIGTYNNQASSILLKNQQINLYKFNVIGDDVAGLLDKVSPDYVINCIGKIKPTIDEKIAESISQANKVNSSFPKELEVCAQQKGIKLIQIGTDCVFLGDKGPYTINDEYDADDVYGQTKAKGELDSGTKMLVRTSIVGPEIKPGISLLNWFLELDQSSDISGFENHMWNGITTLAFANIIKGLIENNHYKAKVVHLTPKDIVSKYELLLLFKNNFNREDIKVKRIDSDTAINRTLLSESLEENKKIWKIAGYDNVPTISELIKELSKSVYTKMILESS